MPIHRFPIAQIAQLAHTDKAYTAADPLLRDFYQHPVAIESFSQAIQAKKTHYTAAQRGLLLEAFQRQYAGIEDDAMRHVRKNLQLIPREKTFTITTAHQPCLFSGPLYVVYKIAAVIKLCEQVKALYPDYNPLPVYWMGSEDHDFEEVNHISLYNKRITWSDKQGGATGRYTTDSLEAVLAEVAAILGESPQAKELVGLLERCYASGQSYAQATRRFLHAIFGKYGLLVLDGDDPALKKSFAPMLETDIFERVAHREVVRTVAELERRGFENQAFPREINLFYLLPNRRERIVEDAGMFRVLNTDLAWDAEAMRALVAQHPERFSPNVVLRPLYQEWVLPNLAYVGGGGEIAYWLERKSMFEALGVPFPMLIRRPSWLWIDEPSAARMEKLGVSVRELFEPMDALVRGFVARNAEVDLGLEAEKTTLDLFFKSLIAKTLQVDASLEQSVLAAQAGILNQVEGIRQKLVKAEKKKQETSLAQLQKLKEKLFPQAGLQERTENFLAYWLQYGDGFLETIIQHSEPLAQEFCVWVQPKN